MKKTNNCVITVNASTSFSIISRFTLLSYVTLFNKKTFSLRVRVCVCGRGGGGGEGGGVSLGGYQLQYQLQSYFSLIFFLSFVLFEAQAPWF